METLSDTPLCVIREMLRIVAPPGSVIIPEMMVWVRGDESDGECGIIAHGMCRLHTRNPDIKKAPLRSGRALHKAWRDLLFSGFLPLHIGRLSPSSHRRISPSSVGIL